MAAVSAPRAVARPAGRLLQVLGVAFGLAVIVGNTIVTGILRTPGQVAAQLPSAPAFLAVWLAGGVFALLGATSLAELGAMHPRSGGQYVYVRYGLGDYPGFAAGSIVLGEYLGVLIPVLAHRGAVVAAVVIVGLSAFQWQGIRWGDLGQQALSAAKTVALL